MDDNRQETVTFTPAVIISFIYTKLQFSCYLIAKKIVNKLVVKFIHFRILKSALYLSYYENIFAVYSTLKAC